MLMVMLCYVLIKRITFGNIFISLGLFAVVEVGGYGGMASLYLF